MSAGQMQQRAGPVRGSRATLGMAAVLLSTTVAGCEAIGFLATNYRENTPVKVEPLYDGLKGKSYAVVVVADRGIDANYPGLVPVINASINDRLHDEAGASGWIPSQELLGHLYNNPRWTATARSDLVKELGVDRLVVVELQEFRLNDIGNQYLWDGRASGLVSVLEADSPSPETFAFEKPVDVHFPDKQGYSPQDMSGDLVAAALRKRFVDRAAWMFYTHDEKYKQEY